jgi:nucleoside-diphosphate-sugar epimerase
MMMNVVHAAFESGVNRIVHASSIQVITRNTPNWHTNEMAAPSSLPYLPADGDIPANPGNDYGLSKQACEELLRFYATKHAMDCVAIRFPWLARPEWIARMREGAQGRGPGMMVCSDECFAFLSTTDAARLIKAILDTPLKGYRVYMPAAKRPRTNRPVADLVKEYDQGVSLRKKPEEMESLVDISRITGETGWEPLDSIW